MEILQSILVLVGMGLISGILLVVAYGKLKVDEDPVIEKITEVLPGLNCGACGYASCGEYASAIFQKLTDIGLCRAGGDALNEKISEITGLASEAAEVFKAVIHCGVKERKILAEYDGPRDCLSASLTGAGLACRYGCFGYGDCVNACPFGALKVTSGVPELDFNLCIGCGLCVDACPRDLIEIKKVLKDKIVYVACSNIQSAKLTRTVCSVGCIGCKICEKRAVEGAFKVENFLARAEAVEEEIDIPAIKCPTACIHEMSNLDAGDSAL